MQKSIKRVSNVAAVMALAGLVLSSSVWAAAPTPRLTVKNGSGDVKFVVNDDGTFGAGVSSTIYPFEMTSDNGGNVPAGEGVFMMKGATNKERFEVRSFGNVNAQGPTFQGKGAGWDGTQPTPTLTNHNLFMLGGNGVDTAGVVPTGNSALIKIKAESNWTTSSHGTVITFETTATGSLARKQILGVTGSGITVGTPLNADLHYTQIDTLAADTAGPPPTTDCDASSEVGRMILATRYSATASFGIYVCTQTSASTYAWKFATLQ